MNIDLDRLPVRSAAAGFLVWSALFAADGLGLIERLCLGGPLLIVPLGLGLLSRRPGISEIPFFHRAALIAQPIGALSASASFLVERGSSAGVLASGWLAVTVLAALAGADALLQRGPRRILSDLPSLCVDLGLLYLPVGGAGLVISRLGLNPLGFDDLIILLAAVHFHYAAFAGPVLAGLAGRAYAALPESQPRAFAFVAAGVILAPALLALGITYSPVLEVLAALFLVAALAVLSLTVGLRVLPALKNAAAYAFLAVSFGSLLPAMLLALLYATGEFLERRAVDIRFMAWSHGLLNGVGFSLAGLIGWTLLRASAPATAGLEPPGAPERFKPPPGWQRGVDPEPAAPHPRS